MAKNLGAVFNPYDEMLSNHFSLADLTATNTGIDNMPTPEEKRNLKWLAGMLDKIYDELGAFRIPSAYRSAAVQERLRQLGYPTSTKKSFHEAGMAADIVPLDKDLNEYFNLIIANFKDQLGEIALKDVEGQKAIHISMPTATTVGKVMYLDEAGKYMAMAADEIEERINSVVAAVEEFASEVASFPTKKPVVFWGVVALTVVGAFMLLSPKARKAT